MNCESPHEAPFIQAAVSSSSLFHFAFYLCSFFEESSQDVSQFCNLFSCEWPGNGFPILIANEHDTTIVLKVECKRGAIL